MYEAVLSNYTFYDITTFRILADECDDVFVLNSCLTSSAT